MNFINFINSLIVLLSLITLGYGQSITGTFPTLKDQPVKLTGFSGFQTYTIDSTVSDVNGQFKLTFTEKDRGMAYVAGPDNKPFIVVLEKGEQLNLSGGNLGIPQTVKIVSGKQNLLFGQYAIEHPKREQTLSAWDFLEKIYLADSLFSIHEQPKNAILTEKSRINNEDRMFLDKLDPKSYLAWYLPVRKLVSSVGTIAQYRTEDIPKAIESFRALDYTDQRFFKSGLLREAIEGHFWLIENSGRPLDSVYIEMNISIDRMMEKLVNDEQKLNQVADHLFGFLERRSLFTASEYLALKVLNEVSCTIDQNLARQLESYRKMKKGNQAPGIIFSGDIYKNGLIDRTSTRLSDVRAEYKLIVFGASWCPKCSEELSRIPALYPKWRSAGLEVIFISLDTDAAGFKRFVQSYPFLSVCDYKKWETQAAKDYHVFATPTMFLLNSKHEILLRPNSVSQLDAWVDMK